MKNILFVSGQNMDSKYGGSLGTKKHLALLSGFGNVDIFYISPKENSFVRKIEMVIFRHFGYFSNGDLYQIKKKLSEKHYDLVCLDGSYYGKLAQYVQGRWPLCVFYHNCEYDYTHMIRMGGNAIKNFIIKKIVFWNEKKVTRCANYRVVLNDRDSKRLKELYGYGADILIPIALDDAYVPGICNNDEKYCLLFGSATDNTVEGYEWFIKNVSPYLNCKTMIAGKGFEEYNYWSNDKVAVLGYVVDLNKLYAGACCVAIPLFRGAGMKTRVAEAMMFGIQSFGSEEAFIGYESDIAVIGKQCNCAMDYINCINALFGDGKQIYFENKIRNIFLEKYNTEGVKKIFGEFLMKNCKK